MKRFRGRVTPPLSPQERVACPLDRVQGRFIVSTIASGLGLHGMADTMLEAASTLRTGHLALTLNALEALPAPGGIDERAAAHGDRAAIMVLMFTTAAPDVYGLIVIFKNCAP